MEPGNFVLEERHGPVIVLRLNRPDELNRLSTEDQFIELATKIREIDLDPLARALIITGSGQAFSAGGDLQKMAVRDGFSSGTTQEVRLRYKQSIHQVPLALNSVDIPTIAAVNGPAYGAGCDLACLCDIRIAASSASFCVSFAQLGIVSGDGGSWILPRLIGRSKAMELTFTANPISAAQALTYGLISEVTEPEQLLPTAIALAETISRHPRDAMRLSKRLLRTGERSTMEDHLDLVAAFQAIAHASEEHITAVNSFLSRLKNRQG